MIFLFSFLSLKLALGAHLLMDCPRNQVKFEKIIGLRPSNYINGYLLHKQQNSKPVTTECLAKCMENEDCVSVVLHYNVSECYWYGARLTKLEEHENVVDPDVAWFEKTCLQADSCRKMWIFDRIPGATFVGSILRTLPDKISREDCQQRCLDEPNNLCRSVKFKILDDHNSTRTLGKCSLSFSDRHLDRSSYRISGYNDEYFENQCSNVTTNEFCAYEEYENVVFTHVDLKYEDISQANCEEVCESMKDFNCRGYSLIPLKNTYLVQNGIDDRYECLIHSENSKIHGPGSLRSFIGGRFFEKARCLNITVSCSESQISIKYSPEVDFFGKIYMNGFSELSHCYAEGSGKKLVTLEMPLNKNQCGILEARSVNHVNRTLLSGTMILQYNRLIQTQGDRLIKVGCIFANDNTIILGTGVNFNSSLHPNKGTTIFTASNTSHPTVEMKITDVYSDNEIADTQIGQELQLVIEIKPPNGPYDIWAGHLVAMTEEGHDSILLLDDRGCPTNLNVFPALTKVSNDETKKLVAKFQAFKFTASPIVRFSVIVQFCPFECPTVICDSKTRRKRHVKLEKLQLVNESSITEIDRSQYNQESNKIVKMPLELVLIVRNSKISPDRLVYGDNNKILVAGYDLATNEVCVDYSLMIGIVITWTLTQVIIITCCFLIIRRYKKYYKQENTTQSLEELHKNFGLGFSNLEPRRVHWADNYDFT